MLPLTRNWQRLAGLAAIGLIALATTLSLSSAQTSDKPNAHSRSSEKVDFSQPLTISWRYESNLTLNLTPAFDDERIYLPLAGGTIVSLVGASGQLNWRSEMGGELSASPVADRRGVYVASETGKPEGGNRSATGALRALGREGGVTQWMRTLAMPLRGALALGDGRLFGGGKSCCRWTASTTPFINVCEAERTAKCEGWC